MTHTPGPWQIKEDYTHDGRITVIANIDGEYFTDDPQPHMTYDTIARCEDEFGECLPNAADNARLIAAAPELLEALQALRLFASEVPILEHNPRFQEINRNVLKAVAKALGR